MVDIEYVVDVALLDSVSLRMQARLSHINNLAALFRMRFTPPKFKLLLQNWMGSNPNLHLAHEPINVVDHTNYLGKLYSPVGLAKDEVTQRIAKNRAAFANLRHLRHRRDISLSIKGSAHNPNLLT